MTKYRVTKSDGTVEVVEAKWTYTEEGAVYFRGESEWVVKDSDYASRLVLLLPPGSWSRVEQVEDVS